MGLGAWNEANVTSYNLVDPLMRDTVTVLFNSDASNEAGWTAFRWAWWAGAMQTPARN